MSIKSFCRKWDLGALKEEIKSFHCFVKTSISEESLICHEGLEKHKNRVDSVSNLNQSYNNENEDYFEDPKFSYNGF